MNVVSWQAPHGGGDQRERDLSAQFAEDFAEFQRVDDELLTLAVKNTNVKAYSLAFGPAAAAIEEMNAALDRLLATNAYRRRQGR